MGIRSWGSPRAAENISAGASGRRGEEETRGPHFAAVADARRPDASWRAFENHGIAIITSPGGAEWWAQYKGVLGQEFVEAIDETVAGGLEERPSIYDIYPHWRL